jgi:hypothetical protein
VRLSRKNATHLVYGQTSCLDRLYRIKRKRRNQEVWTIEPCHRIKGGLEIKI